MLPLKAEKIKHMKIEIKTDKNVDQKAVLQLYQLNEWSSAQKPDQLYQGLLHSHTLITAWHKEKLVGLGNALSDSFLVVYYPHLLVHPDYQGKGIGKKIMDRFNGIYEGFHQQILVSDANSIEFYKKCGFSMAGKTQSMWIYLGSEH